MDNTSRSYGYRFYMITKQSDAQGNPTQNWVELSGSLMPFGAANYLDERIDEAYITIRGSEIAFFKPTTEIVVSIFYFYEDDSGDSGRAPDLCYVVASDDAQDCPINYGRNEQLYRHELCLVEITKLLEGCEAEASMYTNTSGTAYSESDWVVA